MHLHAHYLCQLSAKARGKLVDLVDQTASVGEADDESEEDLLTSEVEQQWMAATEAVDGFHAQNDVFELVHSYVVSDERKPLVLFGDVGTGKTAIIGKAALEVCVENYADMLLLPLDEAIASGAVFVIVSGSDGRKRLWN